MKQSFILAHDTARKRAMAAVADAPEGYCVEVSEPKRSDAENKMLHAILTQISKRMEWAGKRRDVETWKRLLTAAWCRARGEAVEFLPALDGNGVDIVFRRTSELTRGECAELIEYVQAWAIDAGIDLDRPVAREYA